MLADNEEFDRFRSVIIQKTKHFRGVPPWTWLPGAAANDEIQLRAIKSRRVR